MKTSRPAAESFKVPQTFRPAAESFKPSPSTRTNLGSTGGTSSAKVNKPEIILPPSGGETPPPPPPPPSGNQFPAAGTFAGWEYSADKKKRRMKFNDGQGGFYYGAFENVAADDEEQKDTSKSNPAYATISKILESYGITGLASVIEEIRKEYPEASSDDIVTLLQFDDRYNAKFNQRFSANLTRQKAGMSVLSPADYLALEQGYKKVLTAYNLPTFNNQTYYDKFIAADLKTTDIADRVSLAYDRVLNDKYVSDTFKKFYPSLTTTDIVTGMLDPVNQFPALERKVRAAEIGGAALRQGLIASETEAMLTAEQIPYTNVTRGTLGADILGQEGVTKEQAEKGYQTIAGMLPDIEKLSSIYGKTEAQYGRKEAEQEIFQGLASAARKREKIKSLEEAQYLKRSGLGKGALRSQTNI